MIEWSEELKVDLGTGLHQALEDGVVPSSYVSELMVDTLTLLSFYSRTLHEHWLPVFTSLLARIEPDEIESRVIPDVLGLSEPRQKNISKEIAAKLIDRLAVCLGSEFSGAILHRAKALSQDGCTEVRIGMAQAWLSIGQALPQERIVRDELLKLITDHEPPVKARAINTWTELTYSTGFLKDLHVVRDNILTADPLSIARNIGYIAVSFGDTLKDEILEVVSNMNLTSPEVKLALIYNLPALSVTFGSCKPINLLLKNLTEDPLARPSIAKGLHQWTLSKTVERIANDLLEDLDSMVGILRQFSYWKTVIDPQKLVTGIVTYLDSNPPWRQQGEMIQLVTEKILDLPMKDLVDYLFPWALNSLGKNFFKLNEYFSKLIAGMLHHCYYISKKQELCSQLITNLCESSAYTKRLIFLDIIAELMNLTSRRFLETNFMGKVIDLGKDLAHSVRLKYVSMVPKIRATIQNHWFEQFKSVLKLLLNDPVPSIRDIAVQAKAYMKTESFINTVYSEEEQKKEQERLQFEEQQLGLENKEYEDNTKRMINELAAKVKADLHSNKPKKNNTKIKYPVLKKTESNGSKPPSKFKSVNMPRKK